MEASLAYSDDPIVTTSRIEITNVEVSDDGWADYETTLKDLTIELLKTLPGSEWNLAVAKIREEDPDWAPDLSRAYLYECDLSYLDLRGANFESADLSWSNLDSADLRDANLSGANLNRADISYAKLTGSNYRQADNWELVRSHAGAVGYHPPLPDITEQVARHFLAEAIRDPQSIVNDGLDELRASGITAHWFGTTLKFYMTHEIEEQRSACHDGDCYCEVEHACNGECTCCPCYDGRCDCEPEHDYEDYHPTDNYYLATVIGSVSYVWNQYRGLVGEVNMTPDTLHPHVRADDGTVCWGNSENPQSLRAADHLLRVMGWIGQHNPASEYRPINDLPHLY